MTAITLSTNSGHTLKLRRAGDGALLQIIKGPEATDLNVRLDLTQAQALDRALMPLLAYDTCVIISPESTPSGHALYAHLATEGAAMLTIAQAVDLQSLWILQKGEPSESLLLSGQQAWQLRNAVSAHLHLTPAAPVTA